ncbi:mitochondrial carrier domain-containing protein [Aspergillus desertorum]
MAETKAETASTAKEFMVGAAGGITHVIVGQPFDIVKVRLQVHANKSAVQVARDIWKHEGILAFYKGTLPPLLGVGACISIPSNPRNNLNNPSEALAPSQAFLAGGLAGLANSLVSGPTEHIRIRLQTQSAPPSSPSSRPDRVQTQRPYNGAYSCLRRITAAAGLTGLYRGQVPTMLREFGSYGAWFSVYGCLSPRVRCRSGKVASCGALAGVILWGVNYPFDVVKSKMQADGFGSDQHKRVRDVVSQTWRQDGVRGFWRGVGMATGRAVPVCGGTFVVVEMVRGVDVGLR